MSNARKVKLTDLSELVQTFLDQAADGRGIVVEDDEGRLRYGVVPYIEATREEQEAALERLKIIQDKVGRRMKENGLTEDDFDRLLAEENS